MVGDRGAETVKGYVTQTSFTYRTTFTTPYTVTAHKMHPMISVKKRYRGCPMNIMT